VTPAESYPSVDESRDRLHRAGWSVGETAVGPDHALLWVVSGTNGENRIEGRGRTRPRRGIGPRSRPPRWACWPGRGGAMAGRANDRVKLLPGPYRAPRLRNGDHAFCLFKYKNPLRLSHHLI
jgi:hypothetical protein